MPESHFHHFLRDFRITPKLLSQDEAIVVSAELQLAGSAAFASPRLASHTTITTTRSCA